MDPVLLLFRSYNIAFKNISSAIMLDEIYNNIRGFYSDSIQADIESYKEGFKTKPRNESEFRMRLLNSIQWLTHAHSLQESALKKTRTDSSIFNFLSDFPHFSKQVYVIEEPYREGYLIDKCKLSILILKSYEYLGNITVCQEWKEKAKQNYYSYLETYFTIAPDELYKIDPEYVIKKYKKELVDSFQASEEHWVNEYETVEYYEPSEKGLRYINEEKEKLKSNFPHQVDRISVQLSNGNLNLISKI